MSDLKTKTRQFKLHWADCLWLLKEEGQTDDQIQTFENEIRDNWNDDSYRESVCLWAAERSAFRQSLVEMARGVLKCAN